MQGDIPGSGLDPLLPDIRALLSQQKGALKAQRLQARVTACAQRAEQTLALFAANDYNRFSPELQEQVLDQLKKMLPLVEPKQ